METTSTLQNGVIKKFTTFCLLIMYIFSKLFITFHSRTYRQNIAQNLEFIYTTTFNMNAPVADRTYTHVFAIVTINLNIFS